MINKIYSVGQDKKTKIIIEYWKDNKIQREQIPMYSPYVFYDITIKNDTSNVANTNIHATAHANTHTTTHATTYTTFYDTKAIKKPAKKPDKYSIVHYLITTYPDLFYRLLHEKTHIHDVVYDIEIHTDSFPDQEKAEYPIVLITLLDTSNKNMYVISTNQFIKDQSIIDAIKINIQNILTNTKHKNFIDQIFDPDKIHFIHVGDESHIFDFIMKRFNNRLFSGWNIENFDNVYLVNRAMNIGYKNWSKLYSILKNHIDYFGYAKKYKLIPETDSYSLKVVSKVLLGSDLTKLDFDILGFNPDDPDSFIDYTTYNMMDVLISKVIAMKINLNEFVYNIATNVGVPLLTIRHPTETNEWIMYIHMCQRGLVVPINKPERPHRSIQGAYVKEPKPGLYKDVYIYDVGSLYPSMVIAHNVGLDSAVYEYSINRRNLGSKDVYDLDVIKFVKRPDSILKSLFKYMFIERKFLKSIEFKSLKKQYMDLLGEVDQYLSQQEQQSQQS